MEMTLDEVVREMNELEQHMQKFEWKYSIKSAEFYKLVLAGKIEETFELHEWLGLYKLWLNRCKKYLELLKSPSPLLNIAEPIDGELFEIEKAQAQRKAAGKKPGRRGKPGRLSRRISRFTLCNSSLYYTG